MKNYESKTVPMTEAQEMLKMMDYMIDRVNVTCDKMDGIINKFDVYIKNVDN